MSTVLPWNLVSSFFGKNGINLDTKILALHYRVSFRLFLISSLCLTATQVIGGDAISCFSEKGTSKDETLNAFCWTESTFSVVEYFHNCNVRKDCIYPGVGTLHRGYTAIFHRYYQWTSICLLFQAMLCYLPRFLWKQLEMGLQKSLAFDMKLAHYPLSTATDSSMKSHLVQLVYYFKTHRGHHQFYFLKYCVCELLGLVIVIANIKIIDALLRGQFLRYGLDVLAFWAGGGGDNEISPMTRVFPLLAKCTPLKRYGPSGNIVTPDPVCVLPLNSLNDKVYLFLWFYLWFALGACGLALLYRLCTISHWFRVKLLIRAFGLRKGKIPDDLCKEMRIGDWFVVSLMSKNVSRLFLQKFMEELWEQMYQRKLSA